MNSKAPQWQPCRNPSRPPALSACDHRLPCPIPVRECSGRANPPASTRILSPSANFPSTRILNINFPKPPATSNIFGEQVQDLLRQLPGRTSGAGHLGGQKSPSRTIGEQIKSRIGARLHRHECVRWRIHPSRRLRIQTTRAYQRKAAPCRRIGCGRRQLPSATRGGTLREVRGPRWRD